MKIRKSEFPVIFSVYDSFGNFLGYKTDTFWTLEKTKTHAKLHSLENARMSSNLFSNLLNSLNNGSYYECIAEKGHFDEKHSLYVVAEDIRSGEIISHASIKNKVIKEYELAA